MRAYERTTVIGNNETTAQYICNGRKNELKKNSLMKC